VSGRRVDRRGRSGACLRVIELVRSLKKNRRLLMDLVKRDLRGRYVGSSMGFFWSVIFPLLNLAVYMFVFGFVLDSRWRPEQSKPEVALLILCGIVVWQAFAETISRSTNSLVENQNLIQKIVFPAEVLPIYLTVSALVNMLIGLTITLLAVIWFAWIQPPASLPVPAGVISPVIAHPLGFTWTLIFLPVLMLLQGVFTMAYGFFLSALNLFVRDVYHLMGVAITVWMFMTPIFYPPELVVKAKMTWVLIANPMYWLIESYRSVLVYGQMPKPLVILSLGAVSLLLFALGTTFFLRQKPRFPDLL
jgi:ABC-type polysaccharide/polyol phosphate export permease